MLNTKGMRFPIDVFLVCIRWYAAYPLSYRHLEEMMEEPGVSVDHSTTMDRADNHGRQKSSNRKGLFVAARKACSTNARSCNRSVASRF